VLHRLKGHTKTISDLVCIASSSAAPHHPRLVTVSWDGTAKVWDGETGELLADLGEHGAFVIAVAVWKQHTGGHDRIATMRDDRRFKVWDGEALTLLHDLSPLGQRFLPFQSAEGRPLLLVPLWDGREVQAWDPEGNRLVQGGINRGCPSSQLHVFESAQGRHLLAIAGCGKHHQRHAGDIERSFIDVWDLGEAPPRERQVRPAHHTG
jgi:hypothetical protein